MHSGKLYNSKIKTCGTAELILCISILKNNSRMLFNIAKVTGK